MHCNSLLIKIQPDATACRYLFTAKSLYMFQVSQHPSSGVLKTVTPASGTGHNIGTATSLQRGLIRPHCSCTDIMTCTGGCGYSSSNMAWSGHGGTVTAASSTGHNISTSTSLQRGLIRPCWREVAVPILWPVPEAAVTVFSTPDDGCCDTRNM